MLVFDSKRPPTAVHMNALHKQVAAMHKKMNIAIVVTSRGDASLSCLNEAAMNRLGWYRMGAEDAPCPITEAELKERLQRALQQQKTVDTPETEA